jgi:serine/threonine protein kinase
MASFPQHPRFEFLDQLGQGGMGAVFKVRDRQLDREVALKMMRRPGPDHLYFLKQEFRARAGFYHPNLLELYELLVQDEHCYLTMELVEGREFLGWVRMTPGPALAAAAQASTSTLEGLSPQVLSPESRQYLAPIEPAAVPLLREGLAQLVRGLHALHEFGQVHRDVKPSNVLVTRDHRVVLLDFGLATAEGVAQGASAEVAGTPQYMAPEQRHGGTPSRASDLYAVGVMLYQALTGVLPYTGQSRHQRFIDPPVHPLELTPNVPARLAQLAMRLLVPEPLARPGAEQVLAELEQESSSNVHPVPGPRSPGPSRHFIGRGAEIELLERALLEVEQRWELRTVLVQGPSGIGKSTLLGRFLTEPRSPAPVVLRGRCHPEESVPFKALDAVVDALSRYLRTLPPMERAALVPFEAYALVRLFPVLSRIDVLAAAPVPPVPPDAATLRQQGFLALRELMARLARHRPVVVWIDDLQWGDMDSALLLEELVRSPGAPALLLLLSYRSEERPHSALLRYLLDSPGALAPGAWQLALKPLGSEDSITLLQEHLGDRREPRHHLAGMAAGCMGNPFLLAELARYLSSRAGAPTRCPSSSAPRSCSHGASRHCCHRSATSSKSSRWAAGSSTAASRWRPPGWARRSCLTPPC